MSDVEFRVGDIVYLKNLEEWSNTGLVDGKSVRMLFPTRWKNRESHVQTLPWIITEIVVVCNVIEVHIKAYASDGYWSSEEMWALGERPLTNGGIGWILPPACLYCSDKQLDGLYVQKLMDNRLIAKTQTRKEFI